MPLTKHIFLGMLDWLRTISQLITSISQLVLTLLSLCGVWPMMKNTGTNLLNINRKGEGNCNYIFIYQVSLAKRQKGPVGLRVKLPHFFLLTTLGGGFTLSHLMLKIKQESCEYQFLKTRLGIELVFTVSITDALFSRPPID